MKRFFICEFVQESNSFNPTLSGLDDFAAWGILEGEALPAAGSKAGPTPSGMLSVLKAAGYPVSGGVRMRAGSSGPVDHRVVDWFMEKTLTALQESTTPDVLLVSLHGATVSDTSEDVCGDILERLRAQVGEGPIIAATADLHGNITDKFIRNCDILCGYQSYPHLDLYETGERAARLAIEMLEGKEYKTVCVRLPMMAPAHGYTTNTGALCKLMQKGHTLVKEGKIADFTVFQVQPWMNIRDIASTVVIVAEDAEYAAALATEMAEEQWALRQELLGAPLYTVDEVIQIAKENTADAPVVLVDSADSPNAGAVGDCATVIEKLLPHKDALRMAVAVSDVPAVEQAFALGVGGKGDFTLGATVAPKLSRPVLVKDCTVQSLHSGEWVMEGPSERGQRRTNGKTAVLTAGGLQILICEQAMYNGDRQFFRKFGIEPTLCDLVCVKACTSFRAGYAPISADICNAATPGAAGPVLTALPYTKLPKPFFPFEEIGKEHITPPIIFRGKE